jgi:hypothetical protein
VVNLDFVDAEVSFLYYRLIKYLTYLSCTDLIFLGKYT